MANGYVLHTDHDWLRVHRDRNEGHTVLFTRGPNGSLKNLNLGGLLVFMKRASQPPTVAGVGIFARNEVTTLEDAWRDYGNLVGVLSRDAYLLANERWLRKGGKISLLHVNNFHSIDPAVELDRLGVAPRPYAARGWHLEDAEWETIRRNLHVTDLADAPSIGELDREFGSAGEEGRRRQRCHLRIERDRQVVAAAKRAWREADPRLPCEVCRVSFAEQYGDWGAGYIEAHHRVPLHELDHEETRVTRIEDLAPLCANCHRMAHARGGADLATLARLFA